jgi:isopenicillin N synthase-like dioxygenase
MDLIDCLSNSLGLQGLSRLEQYHRSYMPANTCLNLFCYPKSDNKDRFGQIKHTDTGTLTLLFSSHPGLEILSPKSYSWGAVAPIDGHVVVNVGDTLRALSNKRFYSSVHRVSPVFKDSQKQRFVVGYFFRAENDAVVRNSEGNMMTVRQWHDQKYDTYKTPHSAKSPETVLTGGMEGCFEQSA